MKRQVNLGLIGCGNIAQEHLQALKTLPGVRVSACWNRPEEFYLAENAAKIAGADYVTDDVERLASDPAVDAVYICTMHNDRLRHLRACARAGKAVFMEKPLALGREEYREMSALLERHPVLFQSGYKISFHTLMRQLHRTLPNPETAFAHVFDHHWPSTNSAAQTGVGNGHIASQGVYAADSLYFLMGAPPLSVSAAADTRAEDGCAYGTLSASFTFPGGRVGALLVSDGGLAGKAVSKFFVEAAGGGVHCSLGKRFTELSVRELATGSDTVFSGEEDGFVRQSREFLAAVRSGSKNSPRSFFDGLVPSLMIHEALESARTGNRREIDPSGWLAGTKARPLAGALK